MPHADPETSIAVAARHLFRHLRNAAELRRNPLVRSFFATTPQPERDAQALSAIHARVLHEARAHGVGERSSGAHAERQRRIVAALCAGDAPPSTAAALKISRRQYYRERREICTPIARALARPQENRPPPAEVSDPLRLLLARAASLSDQGFAQKSVGLLDSAWPGISRGAPRLLAQVALADSLISLGDVARAGKVLQSARSAVDRSNPVVSRELADRTVLAASRLAIATGDDASAGPALADLAQRQIAEARVDDVALDTLIECGYWHCSNARFEDARLVLQRARSVSRSLEQLPPYQRVALALLEAYCVEDNADVFDGSHRRFREVLAVSAASASMRGTLEATTGLMGYYASIGSDDAMYDLAESALDIARSMEGRRHLLFAAAWIGTTLMKTSYWRAVSPLLFEVERLSPPGTLYWTFVKEAQGDFLARTGRYEAAQASFAAAQDAARKLDNRKWQGIVLRDVGVMLGRLGRAQESAASLRRAVELAEGGAGAWSLSLTYRAASKVLSDAGIARRAAPVAPTCVDRPSAPTIGRRAARRAPLALEPRNDRIRI